MPQQKNAKDTARPKAGLRGLFSGLFGKRAAEEDEDDFRPATPLSTPSYSGGLQAAHAPSRSRVVAASTGAADRVETVTPASFLQKTVAEKEDPANLVPIQGNKLYELYCRLHELPLPAAPGATFNLSLLMDADAQPGAEQRLWLREIERDVRAMPQYAAPPAPAPGEEMPAPVPVDAYAFVRVSADGMGAWLFIVPPLRGGEGLPQEWVYKLLAQQRVKAGIDAECIAAACEGTYLRLVRIALGMPPENGEDGDIVDHFARGLKIVLTVQDDGTVDFKDLGWLQTVTTGEAICDVVPPTPALPGVNVRGEAVPGRAGRPKTAPMGPGTHMSEDGTQLWASMDGVLTFANERFRVDPLLIVKGDVDNGIGNLDVLGDVLIYGDIREGFSVKASGNITVQGMVEGAFVESGGTIQVSRGMNGNSTGTMRAEGDLLCQFIENATVRAKGVVASETIINSRVSSDRSVFATSGRGVIVGGAVRAKETVAANAIGNESNRLIEITLGNTAAFGVEKEELERRRDALTAGIEDKEKNIEYLSAMEEALSYKESVVLDELRQGLPMQKAQLATVARKLALLARQEQDYGKCHLKAKAIHPPLELTIGDIAAELRQPLEHVMVFRDGDAIQVEALSPLDFK